MISSLLESTKNFIASQLPSNEVAEGNIRSGETNDATAPRSPNPHRPHSPAAAASKSPTTPPTATSLLAKPRRPTQPSFPTTHRPRSYNKPTISADEKRLVGDYRIPADAFFIRQPAQHDLSSRSMKHKSSSFQPGLNTIGGNPLQAPTTYGSPHRSRGAGQLKFLDHQGIQVPRKSTTSGHYEPLKSPPRKRQKTSFTDTVDLLSDDEAMLVEVKSPHPQNSQSSPDYAPSITSQSRRSHESVQQAWTGGHHSKHRPHPVSNFQTTDNLLNSRRKKSRTGGVLPSKSLSISLTDLLSDTPSIDMTEQDELSQVNDLKSHHWPQRASSIPRMNPSTSAEGQRDGRNLSISNTNSENLRYKFGRAKVDLDAIQDDQQDEIQMMEERTIRPASRRGNSPIKRDHQANSNSKRRTRTGPSLWPLKYARATFFTPESSDLALKSCTDKEFQIVFLKSGQSATDESINLKKIGMAEADEFSRIRLKGSRDTAGNQLFVDLEFATFEHFDTFCNTFVLPNTTSHKIVPRERAYMVKLHAQPLHVKDVAEAPTVVDDQELLLLESRVQNSQQTRDQLPPRKGLMIHRMSPGNSNPVPRETRASVGLASRIGKEVASSTTRPARSTRNNQVHYDLSEEERPIVEEKTPYSVNPGLGKPWDKPLPYVHGKRRALVNFTDLERLDEDVFLNDSLIDFYLIHLFKQANIPADEVYFFNTMFYSTLTRNVPGDKGAINYAGVARWTAKEDLFNYNYIVVPINESSHWYLAIICNVNNIARKLDTDGLGTSSPAAHSTAGPTLKTSSSRIEDELALAAAPNTDGEPFVIGNDTAVETSHEGDNRISLVDADALETNSDLPAVAMEADQVRTSPAIETARMEELSLSDITAKGITKQSAAACLFAKRKAKKRLLPKCDPDKSIIVVLDSLEGTHARAVRALKDYILEEGRAKRGMEATIEQKTFYAKSDQIPMQENFSDCGVFLLGYAEKFFSKPREFSNRLLCREMDTETDWPDMNASEMRHRMRNILQDMAEKQKAEHKQKKMATKVTKTGQPPPMKTDLPVLTPLLQSPFKEKSPTAAEFRSTSQRQASPAQAENAQAENKTLPPLVKTSLPAPEPEPQSFFQVKSPAKPKPKTQSKYSQPKSEKGELSPSRKQRKLSPKVVIPTTAQNSPKRQISTSFDKQYSAATSSATKSFAGESQVEDEIRSPKKQKQSHAQRISSRHLSPEKLKSTIQSPNKSPRPSKKQPLEVAKQLYPTSDTPRCGSSVDPITVNDSQDGTTILSPKRKARKAEVKNSDTASSGRPRKIERSTLFIETSPQSSVGDGDMLFTNEDKTRFPMDDPILEFGPQAHAGHAPREATLTPRSSRAVQSARAARNAVDKDAFARRIMAEEVEVIPDSPEEKRRSPSHGLPG